MNSSLQRILAGASLAVLSMQVASESVLAKPGSRTEYWKTLAEGKLAARDALLKEYSAQSMLDIDLSDSVKLLQQLASGGLSAESLTRHFIAKSIQAHASTNCITEPLFEQAIAQAQQLDAHLARTQIPIGPLHGLPISLKDQFDIKDIDSTLGWSSLINRPASRDSVLVEILKRAGAIPFVKTNLPQTIMFAETCNPVFGTTTHPMRPGFSPGGSSGGEGALIALHGSLLGWGTDLGGSIRMPAHLCGLFGLRPSHGRLPYHDVSVTQFGNESVPSVVGPLSTDLDLLELAVKTVIDAEPWRLDPKCLPIPWRPSRPSSSSSSLSSSAAVSFSKLKIGVLWDDGVVAPLPPVARALKTTVAALRSAGHEIIDWPTTNHDEIISIMDALYLVDKGKDFTDFLMPDEPIMERVALLLTKCNAVSGSVTDLWDLHRRKTRVQKVYLDSMERTGVDFLLTPAMPTCAAPVGKHCWWVGYTKFVNLLDFSAMVFPITQVSAALGDLQKVPLDRAYRNDFERAAWQEWGSQEDETLLEGLPIGLQLVGKRLDEENVIAATREIMHLLHS